MSVPAGLYYTEEHEWVRVDGSMATIGISAHAQEALGDITYVELPAIETVVTQFKPIATVESVKAASEVYAPISGKVVKVNELLKKSPEVVNQSPYEKGWFAVLEIQSQDELKNLMKSVDYEAYLKENA